MHSRLYASTIYMHTLTHTRDSLTPLWPDLEACQQCCFSIFILHLLRDRQGGLLTPPAPLWRMMGSGRSVPFPLHSSCITLPQQCPILHNHKKPFDLMGPCSHAWCFRQDPWNLIQVQTSPSHQVPSGLPCLNMQNELRPAKWPVTQMSACVCIFISLILGVCNICLFKRPVPSGWDSCPQIGPNALGSENIFYNVWKTGMCILEINKCLKGEKSIITRIIS